MFSVKEAGKSDFVVTETDLYFKFTKADRWSGGSCAGLEGDKK